MTTTKDLEADYINLFPNYLEFENIQEWREDGDFIKEFNLYEDYPPSISSCNTII